MFGLPKLANKNANDMVSAVLANEKRATPNSRIHLFGLMVGVINPGTFTPVIADICLHFLGRLLPKWKGINEFLDNRSVGKLLFSKKDVMQALLGSM